jgi:transcriptional regulator with XRE-family HTH domain
MKNNLKVVLFLQKKTQRDLANMTGITESAISKYINNNRQPRYLNMLKIAKALNLDVKDIWNDKQ